MKVVLQVPLSESDEKLVRKTVVNGTAKYLMVLKAELIAKKVLKEISSERYRKFRELSSNEANLILQAAAKAAYRVLLDYSVDFNEMKKVLDNQKN